MGKNLVIVESPAKAKTINKYLGSDYEVIASYGHVRDLPSKNGAVDPKEGFKFVWEMDERGKAQMKKIESLAKNSNKIFLATDPDREGEAISWHITEVLKSKGIKKDFSRIVFYEITKRAVLEAIKNPQGLNEQLINAYLARRALDYLVGFTLSPILWRKLPGSRSAGRVQSVALRILTEREAEIEKFISEEYWHVEGEFKSNSKPFIAKLYFLEEKLEKFSLPNEATASRAESLAGSSKPYHVSSLEKKQVRRNPSPPFTTSTLQQDASRKLGFSVSKTMQIAQKLYEGIEYGKETVGLITYMRTDSVNMSQQAIDHVRRFINGEFGGNYLPNEQRAYKSKSKNAQEAHEAIRPTDFSITPEKLASILDKDQLRLYTLIWKRAVASQMSNAIFDQLTILISSENKKVVFKATGSTLVFDGFLKLYNDQEEANNDDNVILPPLKEGEKLDLQKIEKFQHFTEPPPRYSEASLVKKMEELGIGRPSTYASIIQVLQDRGYAKLENKRFIPEDRGRIVTAFLVNYFRKYIEYNFTADLEQKLDDIAHGELIWKRVLDKFWEEFTDSIDDVKSLTITEVLDTINNELSEYFFPKVDENVDPRKCPNCSEGMLSIKLGKFGAFIGCSNYPECNYTRPLNGGKEEDEVVVEESFTNKSLGLDPQSNKEIWLKKGPYGFYVEMEEGKKPKRSSLLKGMTPDNVSLQDAVKLLSLPRLVGFHPETKEEIKVNRGRFGPYIMYEGKFFSFKNPDLLMSMTVDEAVSIIDAKNSAEPKAEKSVRVAKFTKAAKTVKADKKATPKKKTVTKKAAASPKKASKK